MEELKVNRRASDTHKDWRKARGKKSPLHGVGEKHLIEIEIIRISRVEGSENNYYFDFVITGVNDHLTQFDSFRLDNQIHDAIHEARKKGKS